MVLGLRSQYSITPILLYSTPLVSTLEPLIQPQKRQHFVDESLHLRDLIIRSETQDGRSDAHVDPILNEPRALPWGPVRKPYLD
jgi:hypothetical protein